MTNSLRAWWGTRTTREQQLLLVMAGLAGLVLAWLLVIRPLDDALARAQERHGRAVVALAETRTAVASVAALQGRAPTATDAPLDTLLNNSAVEAGFPVTSVTRQSATQANIVMPAVKPQAFFGWVAQMEGRGLIVDRLTANANTDATLSVDVAFRTRRS